MFFLKWNCWVLGDGSFPALLDFSKFVFKFTFIPAFFFFLSFYFPKSSPLLAVQQLFKFYLSAYKVDLLVVFSHRIDYWRG